MNYEYAKYATEKASVEEVKAQNNYLINALNGKNTP